MKCDRIQDFKVMLSDVKIPLSLEESQRYLEKVEMHKLSKMGEGFCSPLHILLLIHQEEMVCRFNRKSYMYPW